MIKQLHSLFNRLSSFGHLRTVVSMSAPVTNDNEGNLSKRAMKRLYRRRLYEASKMDENAKKLAKEIKEQKRAEAKQEKKEDLILEKFLLETDYYFENGLRKVYPYYYDFMTYAKGRWYGSHLVDVFVKEFQNYTVESCVHTIKSGNVQVNGKVATTDHVIQNGDFILNKVHRHELPVTAESPTILVNNDEFIVVDKPASIPIHPCGRYRHNSLIYILAKEHGFCNLRTIYRLDRLTSGLVIFCKTEAKTKEMMRCISQRKMQKEYLCQVEGLFPNEVIECNQPIGPLSQKLGIYKTDATGKQSKTTFERIGYDGQTSTVRCKPYTGRTHQIRVHLQYLGFPIINDPLYNGPGWGPNRGKDGDYGKTDKELIEELMKQHSSSLHLDAREEDLDVEFTNPLPPDGAEDEITAVADSNSSQLPKQVIENDSNSPPSKRFKRDCDSPLLNSDAVANCDAADESKSATGTLFSATKVTIDENCRECKLKFVDPKPEELIMFLHAYRYKGPGWEFSTPLPKWAAGIELLHE